MFNKQKGLVNFGLVLLITILLGIGGFFIYKQIYTTNVKPSKKTTPVTVRLKWLHQSQFAGHYVADKKGLYKDAGLDVTLKSFDYEHLPINEVLSGKADFGVTGADELLLAREEEKPVVALAVIYQENPVTAYALADSGIATPTDFIDKKVGIEGGINVEFMMRAMLASQNIDYDKDINVVPIEYDYKPLTEGVVDVATGYVTNEPIQAEAAGYPVTIISPVDYGINVYADVLFTTEEMIENNPELVDSFVKATLEGWEYALNNIDEAVKYTLMYEDTNNEALTVNHQTQLLENSIGYIKPKSSTKVGQMNFELWSKTYQLLEEYGIVTGNLDVKDAYTTKFIK